jgi:integrase/recombinase XerD
MLEQFFVKPSTVDRLRASWIGVEIDAYVVWLSDHGYGPKAVWRRVPLVYAFGEHARAHGAESVSDLPRFVEDFVSARVAEHHRRN